MSYINLLHKIMQRAKAGVHIEINGHRNVYETAADKLMELKQIDLLDVSDEVRKHIIETDTLIKFLVYKDTPVGFHLVFHYDLELAVQEMAEQMGLTG